MFDDASSGRVLALSNFERHGFLVPGIPRCLLQRWAGQVDVPRLAIFRGADVHNLHLNRSSATFDGRTLSAGPPCLVEVALVQGRVVRVPRFAQTLRVEAAGVLAGTVDLDRFKNGFM